MTTPTRRSSVRFSAPLLFAAAIFTAAGGYVHAREWERIYRHVPTAIPGSALVRVGFPINALTSLVFAVALAVVAVRLHRYAGAVILAASAFQVGSLAVLILSRTGGVLGWMETGWSTGADQTRAAEIGALVSLLAAAALGRVQRQSQVET